MAPMVFIFYDSADREVADTIKMQLAKRGISITFDSTSFEPGAYVDEEIKQVALSASNCLLLLLSPTSVQNAWMRDGFSAAFISHLEQVGTTLIPVKIERCEVPVAFRDRQYIDISDDFEIGLNKLTEFIHGTTLLDFAKLGPNPFKNLIADLLTALGFSIIELNSTIGDTRIDILAETQRQNPLLHSIGKGRWVVEAKLYQHERPRLVTLRELVSLAPSLPKGYQVLLVTNGYLTSVTKDWLKDVATKGIQIAVIEGPELSRLILLHNNLISKYFKEPEIS